MFPSLCQSTNVPVTAILVLTAVTIQRSVVRAQSYESTDSTNNPYYYYWLTPGRIVGIAIGAIALIFLILSMLIIACRRRRHAKATSRVMVSNFSGQPPSWQTQQLAQTPDASTAGWYYTAQGAVPPDQVKRTATSDQARRSARPEQSPSSASIREVLRTPSLDQVQRPAPTSQDMGTATSGQVQRPVPTSRIVSPPTSGQVQRTAAPGQAQRPAGQAQTTVPSGQVQSFAPPGQLPRYAPSDQVQGITPGGQRQSPVPFVRAQEQGAPIFPPPRHARTKGAPSASAANGRESPPPYYPPTPPTPPPAHTAR